MLVRLAPLGFIPYSDIERVEATATGAAIVRKGGDVVRWAFVSVASRALRERIEAGLAAFRRAEPAEVLPAVAREGRPAKDWLEGLRKAGAEADCRDVSVTDDVLWRIAEDPTAPASARAGAAVILRGRGGESARVRIAAAATATVAPRVRVALSAAAGDDEDELVSALDRCDDGSERDPDEIRTVT